MSIQPFKITIPQATLDNLRERLARTRWPDEVEGAGWDYGTNLGYLKELVDYWQHDYDWRKQEAKLNQFAQFRADIDGFGIHFVHERGRGPNPLRCSSSMAGLIHSIAITNSSPYSPIPASHGGIPPTPSTSSCPVFQDLASPTGPLCAAGGCKMPLSSGRSS